jgi:hypothetical protein
MNSSMIGKRYSVEKRAERSVIEDEVEEGSGQDGYGQTRTMNFLWISKYYSARSAVSTVGALLVDLAQ